MDVSGLVLTSLSICFEVTSTLYSYGKQVKGAKRDIQNLSNELFGLIGALEHLKIQQEQQTAHEAGSFRPLPNPETNWDGQNADNGKQHGSAKDSHQASDASVLKQTLEFLQELQKSLNAPKGRWCAAVQRLKWPLRESEVQKHLTRLERVKTYFVLSLVTDEVDQSRKTASEILSLRTLLEDVSHRQQAADFRKRSPSYAVLKLIEPGSEHQAMMEWLCPVDPSITRKSTEKIRMPGTGTWFTKSEELQRQSKSDESSCFWLNGISRSHLSHWQTHVLEDLFDCLNFTNKLWNHSWGRKDYFAVSGSKTSVY